MLWLTQIRRFLVRGWHRLGNDRRGLSETCLSAEELVGMLGQASLPSFNFYTLLALATAIATWGLLADNAVTIVGAMIIAPLMNPIISLSYAVIAADRGLLERATLTLVTGIILTIGLSFCATHLLGTKVVGSQILGRIEPNLLDLGVAFASGTAAGLAYTRRSISNTLPGVAIAVALVPPLCVTGIGFSLGGNAVIDLGLYFGRAYQELNLTSGSFLLFVTNLAGIICCAGIVFLIQGYGNLKKALGGLFLTFVLLGLVSLLLFSQLKTILIRDRVLQSLDRFGHLYAENNELADRIDTTNVYLENRDRELYARFNVLAPIGAISQKDVDSLQGFLSEELEKPVKLEINLLVFEILKNEPAIEEN